MEMLEPMDDEASEPAAAAAAAMQLLRRGDVVDLMSEAVDAGRISFGRPIKLGGSACMTILKYADAPHKLYVALPPLTAAWPMTRGYGGSASARDKWSLKLEVPAGNAYAAVRSNLNAIDVSAEQHVQADAERVYGPGGVGLNGDELSRMLEAVEVFQLPFYGLLRENGGRFSVTVKFAVDRDGDGRPTAPVVDAHGARVEPAAVVMGSRCAVVAHVKGLYVTENMVSVQFNAVAVQVLPPGATDADFKLERLYAPDDADEELEDDEDEEPEAEDNDEGEVAEGAAALVDSDSDSMS